MFLCRRWRANWWRCAGSSILTSTSWLSKCPKSPLHPVILAGAVCASRSRLQDSWWTCRRSYPTLSCTGLWSRTWTFQFLTVVVESVVVVSSVYTKGRVQQRLVEQSIFQLRLPSKSLTFQCRVVAEIFLLQRRLLVCRVRQIKGFFRTFHRGKKCAVGSVPGSELGADFTSSTLAAELKGFFIDENDDVWMRLPSGQWTLLGSDQHVLRDEPG